MLHDVLTTYSSLVIEELQKWISGSDMSMAFLYFDYYDRDRQSPNAMMASVLKQVLAGMSKIPTSVEDAYTKAQGTGASLPLSTIETLLLDVAANEVSCIYLIVDALDECDDLSSRRVLLQSFNRLLQSRRFRLFVTSREHLDDINSAFRKMPDIKIQAQDADLRRYMQQQIECAGLESTVDDELSTEIVETIAEKAQGL